MNPKTLRVRYFLLFLINKVIDESKYSSDSKGDYAGALLTRVRSLITGLNGLIFSDNDIPDSELFDRSVIIDLSRIGSVETKSLIMGLLVMKLNEYRMSSGESNQSLKHITVIEEAHNLLKRVSTEQYSESSNILGKSVELLTNSIAEMRTYGEGFIIADQSPGALDLAVIRNTNTKIILKLPEKSDREVLGGAVGLTDEQTDELSKLKSGTAVIYQNDWVEPVLVQINKCNILPNQYIYDKVIDKATIIPIKTQMVNFLLCGRLNEISYFNIELIEREYHKIPMSKEFESFLKNQISYYRNTGELRIWVDDSFLQLSKNITNFLGLREYVQKCVIEANDNEELNKMLKEVLVRDLPCISENMILTVSQCLMRELGADGAEIRKKIYCSWLEYNLKRRR